MVKEFKKQERLTEVIQVSISKSMKKKLDKINKHSTLGISGIVRTILEGALSGDSE